MKTFTTLLFITVILTYMLSCTQDTPPPDYTPVFVGTFEGSIIDSGATANNVPYRSEVGNSRMVITADATGQNTLATEAYVSTFKSFAAKAKATSESQLEFAEQAINAAFTASGKGTLTGTNLKVELKINDKKYLKFIGKKKP
jgi:transposase